jgi:lipoprotein-anchoring transpeptidase ErfK/SrfK
VAVLGSLLTAGWLTAAVFGVPAAPASVPGEGAPSVWVAGSPRVLTRPGGHAVGRLSARTPYGTHTRLWVRARRGGWLKVSTPDAPGGAGWIAQRRTRPAPRLWRGIEIDRSARRLTVIGARRRWSAGVVVGAPSSPTPLGTFQVTDRLPGERFRGVYGDWILVLSAYGTAARTSRLAVHGVPPAARSRTGSAGCVRVPAAALARLAREIPPGTPVRIRA